MALQFRQTFLILAIGTSALLLHRADLAYAGNESSGGGDPAELEFVSIGQGLMNGIKERGDGALPLIDLSSFQVAVERTTVSMKRSPLFLNGIERTAINHPKDLAIEVNRSEWLRLKPVDKVALAFHEYLGIAGIEHDIYAVSSQLQSALGIDQISKIAQVAAPNPEYRCALELASPHVIQRTSNAEMWGQHIKACGEVNVKRTIVYEDHAGHFPECDAYLFAPLHASYVDAPDRLSEFQLLVPDKGELRASYIYDIYDAPAVFAMRLSFSKGKLFWKKDFTYKLVCNKLSK